MTRRSRCPLVGFAVDSIYREKFTDPASPIFLHYRNMRERGISLFHDPCRALYDDNTYFVSRRFYSNCVRIKLSILLSIRFVSFLYLKRVRRNSEKFLFFFSRYTPTTIFSLARQKTKDCFFKLLGKMKSMNVRWSCSPQLLRRRSHELGKYS